MKITFTGLTGLMIETGGKVIMVDPYLSDNLRQASGPDFERMVPVSPELLAKKPDMILLSHVHGDHTDLPSLEALLDTEKTVQVLASANAWKTVRERFDKKHNYITAYPHIQWTNEYVHIRVVPAVHSDETGVGFLIHAEGKTVYFTGDTLYQEAMIRAVDEPVDVLFAVMNGKGNNMNSVDAARMAEKLAPGLAVPVHWGMFRKFSAPPEDFVVECAARGVTARIVNTYDSIEI